MKHLEDLHQEDEYRNKDYYALVVFKNGKTDTYMGTKHHFDARKKYWQEIDFVEELTSDEFTAAMRNSLGMNKFNKSIRNSDKNKVQRQADYKYLKSSY